MNQPDTYLRKAFKLQDDFIHGLSSGRTLFYEITGFNRPLMLEEMCELSREKVTACAVAFLKARNYQSENVDEDAAYLVTFWFVSIAGRLQRERSSLNEAEQLYDKTLTANVSS